MELPRKALPHVCHPRRTGRKARLPLVAVSLAALLAATWPTSLIQGFAPQDLPSERPLVKSVQVSTVPHFEERVERANLLLKDFFRQQGIGSKELLTIHTGTEGLLYEAAFFISPFSRKPKLEKALDQLTRAAPGAAEVHVTQSSPAETLWVVNISIDERRTHELTFYFSAPTAKAAKAPSFDRAPARGRIALVFDDLGDSREPVNELLSLDAPLTLSFLPDTRYGPSTFSKELLVGKEIFLHVPMEPDDSETVNGTDFILMGMSDEEITSSLSKQLDRCPLCTGFNNHMGSRVTKDARLMAAVLRVAKERQVMFLDSRTSNQTIGFSTALQMRVPTAMRDVFLDHDPSPRAIERQFQVLRRIARNKGQAIAIGHPHPSTLQILKREIARLRQEGYELVTVNQLKRS